MADTSSKTNGLTNALSVRACVLPLALLISAYLMSVAVATPGYGWLGWVTLFPLFYAIRVLRPGVAFAAGAFWGLSLFVAVSISSVGFSSNLASLGLMTIVPGVYAALGAKLTRQVGFSPYLLALGWMGVELALSPLGLHNGLLLAAQGDTPVLHVLGSFTGYAVVAFVVAYLNAMLFTVLSDIRLVGGSLPRISVALGTVRRFVSADVPFLSSHLLQPSSPRAPPALIF